MERLVLCLVTVVILCWSGGLADGRNPGFKARITSRGLNYANKVAIEALSKNVRQLKIPDINGKASGVKYSVWGMAITSFTPPASTIALNPNKGLTWKAANAQIALHGSFRAKKWFVSVSGSFDISAKGLSFNLGINLGDDTQGRPKLTPFGCSCSLGSVSVKIHGDASWFLNLFKGKIASEIKSALQSKLCTVIQNEITVDGNKKLQNLPKTEPNMAVLLHVTPAMPLTVPLAKKFLLDYRLTAAPEFAATYMETFHKGEIYWLADPKTEAPVTPPPMKDSSATQNMMYLWVSDYIFATIAYVAQKHNYLKYNLTAKDLPPDSRGVLNTSCDGFIPKCVGKLIPAIGEKYPNSQVELHMNSTMVPNMTISSSGVSVKCRGQIKMFANTHSGQMPFLVTLNANMSTSVSVSVVSETIHAKIDQLSLTLGVGESKIGPIDHTALQFLVDSALKLYIEPKLNALGEKGFPLPVTDEIKFINTQLSFALDTIIIGTDLSYTPKAAIKATVKKTDDTLRYKPSYDPENLLSDLRVKNL